MGQYRNIAESLDKAFRRAPRKNGKPSDAFVKYLAIIYSDEEAEILQHMKGYPGFLTSVQIAEKAGKTPARVEEILFKTLEKNAVTRMGNTWCIPPVTLLLNLTSGLSNADFDAETAAVLHREFFVDDGYYKLYETSEKGTPSLRALPVNQAIYPDEKVLKNEEAHELIQGLPHDDIVFAPCPCRYRKETLGQRECADKYPVGSCIFLGVSALSHEAAGVGTRVTKKEAIAYFDEMHKMGLVGTTDNMLKDNIIICLCCGCCCSHLSGRTRWENPDAVAPSSFIPEPGEGCIHCGKCAKKCPLSAITVAVKEKAWSVDLEKCIGCGVCTGSCPAGVLKMKRLERSEQFPSQDALYKRLARENKREYP